ncbi:MAG: PTS sugar transporter subunit IIB [Firmicutes bacterium]|nr:PTS sugar transporter subunit IIB [Bacillota bacterium]
MKKIACICGSGLGSSLLVAMNVKSAIKEMHLVTEIDVEHMDLGSAWPGLADVIVCGQDLQDNCKRFADVIPLNNIMDKKELKEKLTTYFSSKGIL